MAGKGKLLTVREACLLLRRVNPGQRISLGCLYNATDPLVGYRGAVLPVARRVGRSVFVRCSDVLAFARKMVGGKLPKARRQAV
jgi:hypothetical protein